jgi:hypothetical protein
LPYPNDPLKYCGGNHITFIVLCAFTLLCQLWPNIAMTFILSILKISQLGWDQLATWSCSSCWQRRKQLWEFLDSCMSVSIMVVHKSLISIRNWQPNIFSSILVIMNISNTISKTYTPYVYTFQGPSFTIKLLFAWRALFSSRVFLHVCVALPHFLFSLAQIVCLV